MCRTLCWFGVPGCSPRYRARPAASRALQLRELRLRAEESPAGATPLLGGTAETAPKQCDPRVTAPDYWALLLLLQRFCFSFLTIHLRIAYFFFFLWELKLRPLLIEMLGEPSLLTLLYTHQRASGLCLPKRTQSRGMGSLAHSFTHSFVRLLFCSLSEYFSANFIPDTVSHVGHIAVDRPTP